MPAGKIAAQAGHAFIGALSAGLQSADPEFRRWSGEYAAEAIGTKVCLEADLKHLIRLEEHLRRQGIPCFLVEDSGHVLPPDFDGSPVVTALGVSPLPRFLSKKHLKSVRLLSEPERRRS